MAFEVTRLWGRGKAALCDWRDCVLGRTTQWATRTVTYDHLVFIQPFVSSGFPLWAYTLCPLKPSCCPPLLDNHRSARGALCSHNTVGFFYHSNGCFRQLPFSCSLLLEYIIAWCHGFWLIKLPVWVSAAWLVGRDAVGCRQALRWQVFDMPGCWGSISAP